MAVATVHKLDALLFPHATVATRLDQNTSHNIDPGITTMIERGSGGITPKFTANQQQVPRISATTQALATLHTNIAAMPGVGSDVLLGAAITTLPLTLYLKKMGQVAPLTRTATSHVSAAVNAGFLYIDRINLESNGESTADIVVICMYDGANVPVVYTGSVALPTAEGLSNEHFGAGPVTINGTTLGDVQRITYESGIQPETLFGNSEVWATFAGLKTTEQKLTIVSLGVETLPTTGVDGATLTSGVTAYGRKFTKDHAGDVARVADGTAEHLKLVAAQGKYFFNPQASGSDAYENTITVEPTSNSDIVSAVISSIAAIT